MAITGGRRWLAPGFFASVKSEDRCAEAPGTVPVIGRWGAIGVAEEEGRCTLAFAPMTSLVFKVFKKIVFDKPF